MAKKRTSKRSPRVESSRGAKKTSGAGKRGASKATSGAGGSRGAKKQTRRATGPLGKPTRGPKAKPPGRRKRSTNKPSDDPRPRLQKVLAAAGYGSRRACEELILEGRVEVDRKICVELGTRVDLETQLVRVDGTVIKAPRMRYFLLNKPVGVVCTARDPWARIRVIDLIDSEERVFTVGRLDKASSGLMLVTNDGELANQLAHPRYGITKTYQATVSGKPSAEAIAKIRKGIHLAEAVARVVTVKMKKAHPQKSILEIVLSEGRNREIRRMLARVGHKVLQLKRTELGGVKLGEIPAGAYRELTREELKKLKQATSTKSPKKKTGRRPASASSARKGPSTTEGKSRARKTTSQDQISSKKPARSKSVSPFSNPGKAGRFSGAVLGGDSEPDSKSRTKKKSKRPPRRKK